MPLPRPGQVNRVPEATSSRNETLPQLTQAALQSEQAPALGGMAPPLEETAVSPVLSGNGGGTPPPWEQDPADEAPEVVLSAPSHTPPAGRPGFARPGAAGMVRPVAAAAQRPSQPVHTAPPPVPEEQAIAPYDEEGYVDVPPPGQVPAVTAATQMAYAPGSNIAGANAQSLATMGFEGLNIGFGSFPIVKLQGEKFLTSEGDDLGNSFVCVIHNSRKKWIVKNKDANDAEFKYTYDKKTDISGRPLETTFNIWRAQGILPGEPIFKEYLDVTAQLVDYTRKELGQVVLLSVPQTSIPRFSGYITTIAVAQGTHPNQVITQVYLGAKVTNVKFPFHPWAFKAWAPIHWLNS